MSMCVVTGSGGLVGSEAVRHFANQGYEVVGLDNDMRSHFFGPEASTKGESARLHTEFSSDQFRLMPVDIRNAHDVDSLFKTWGKRVALVIHCAAQPAHDWAARDPRCDFGVNALGTLNVIEATRLYADGAPFIHCSTSKVYGSNPNLLPLIERENRLDLPMEHPYFNGITTDMSIDHTTHSLFGASKAAADLVVQEYGRYFEMPTVCFRPGCISGAQHQGAELHGFLSYLMRCLVTNKRYRVIGYDGKQVRCNIHASDLVQAFDEFYSWPSAGAVYNIGGGRDSNCSMREAIVLAEQIAQKRLDWTYVNEPRIGDHRWWISSNEAFQDAYPTWRVRYDTRAILQEIYDFWTDDDPRAPRGPFGV